MTKAAYGSTDSAAAVEPRSPSPVDGPMTTVDETVLKAEVLALQAVLISVFRRLAADRPDLGPLFCRAFDEAEAMVTGVAVRIGAGAPIDSTVGALKVIDEMRVAVIRDERICRGA